jgi:hypothetical protein
MTTTRLRHRRLRPRRPRRTRHKLSFPLPRVDYYFTFAAPDTWGLHHEKSSCISLTLKNCESPSSWCSLLNPWQFCLQSQKLD